MKKKAIILIGMIVIVIFAVVSAACPDQMQFESELRKIVFDYLNNPDDAKFTLIEVKDMIEFYFMYDDVSEVDCSSVLGNITKAPISDFLVKSNTIENASIPKCTDGTNYGECSYDQPKFCYAGMLVQKCHGPDNIFGTFDDCGCKGSYYECLDDGTCSYPDIKCAGSLDCGIDTDIGAQFCKSDDVYIEHINWKCLNPGTGASKCNYTITQNLVKDCGFSCSEGSCN